jgi:hypothetical protein
MLQPQRSLALSELMLNQSSGIDWLHKGTKQELGHEQEFHRKQKNIEREKRTYQHVKYTSSAWKQSDLGGTTQQHEEGEFIKSFLATQNT